MAKVDYRKIKMTTVAMKAESVRGTYETLAAADTYCVQNAVLPTVTANVLELDCSNGTMTPADGTVLVGDQEVSLTFEITFPIDGIATTPYADYETNMELIWNAAGFSLTAADPATAMIPVDASATGISISYNVDGWEYRVRGCVASEMVVSLVTKENAKMMLTMIGTLNQTPTAQGKLESVALSTTGGYTIASQIVGGTAFDLDSATGGTNYLAYATSIILTVTNTVIPITSVTATKGIAYHTIIDRDSRIMLECSPFWLSTDQADDEVYAFFTAGTRVDLGVDGVSDSDMIQFKGKITAFEDVDVDGALKHNVEIKATGAVADLRLQVFPAS